MKKLSYLLLTCSMLLLFSSCKKDGSGDYYFKIKKNGTWIEYKNVAGEYGPDLGNPSFTDMVITGQNAGATEIFDIVIQNEASSIPNGSYATDNSTSTYSVVLDLLIQSGTSLTSYRVEDAPAMAPSKYIVTITSITDEAITGNFTGNYLFDDSATPETVAITEGEFRVKRIR